MLDVGNLYPLLLFVGACTLVCIIILIIVSMQLLCDYDPCVMGMIDVSKPIQPVQYLSILSVLSFIVCLASQICIIKTVDSQLNIPDNSLFQQIICTVNIISWAFGQLCIYSIFTLNLNVTFQNTPLYVSKGCVIFLCISISIFFMLQLTYSVIFLLYYNVIITQKYFGWIAAILVSCTEFIDLIVSVVIVYLFVKRLFKLFLINKFHNKYNKKTVKNESINKQLIEDENAEYEYPELVIDETVTEDVTKNSSKSFSIHTTEQIDQNVIESKASKISSTTFSSLNMRQKTILNTASKYTILTTVAIISTQLFLLSGVNNGISIVRRSEFYYEIGFWVYMALLALDCAVNALCICLNFEVNKVWFNGLCFCCDACCTSICIWVSRKCYKRWRYTTRQ
eukprot:215317_1